MPVTDGNATNDRKIEEVAYEDFTRAVAAHTLLCASPRATPTQRFNAAMETQRKWRAFTKVAGARLDHDETCLLLDEIDRLRTLLAESEAARRIH